MLVFGLALPVIIITLVGLTFGGGRHHRDRGPGPGRSPRSEALIDRLEDLDGVELKHYDDERAMRRDVRTTDTNAGVIVPEGYGATSTPVGPRWA